MTLGRDICVAAPLLALSVAYCAIAAAAADALPDEDVEKLPVEVSRCHATTDGKQVKVRRCVGGMERVEGGPREMLNPFLVFDAYWATEAADFAGGFPAHPHRGFLEIRYLLAGRLHHSDGCGGRGTTGAGGAQLFFTGGGGTHEEKTEPHPAGADRPPGVPGDVMFAGFQVWLNVPAKDKYRPPTYQSIPADALPAVSVPGRKPPNAPPGWSPPPRLLVKVLAGRYGGGKAPGPISANYSYTVDGDGFMFLDVQRLSTAAEPFQVFHNSAAMHAFLYVYGGAVRVGDRDVTAGHFVLLGPGNFVRVTAVPGPGPSLPVFPHGGPFASFVYLTAPKVHERVFLGPGFALESEAQLKQAFRDLADGRASRCNGERVDGEKLAWDQDDEDL